MKGLFSPGFNVEDIRIDEKELHISLPSGILSNISPRFIRWKLQGYGIQQNCGQSGNRQIIVL